MFNQEIRNRIRVSVAAYAYEYLDQAIMSDADFDVLCKSINPALTTGNAKLDTFFRDCFSADTGMWIHKHPEKDKLKNICSNYFS
jgi:hypothetical protein